jgi:hypothetical protein
MDIQIKFENNELAIYKELTQINASCSPHLGVLSKYPWFRLLIIDAVLIRKYC